MSSQPTSNNFSSKRKMVSTYGKAIRKKEMNPFLQPIEFYHDEDIDFNTKKLDSRKPNMRIGKIDNDVFINVSEKSKLPKRKPLATISSENVVKSYQMNVPLKKRLIPETKQKISSNEVEVANVLTGLKDEIKLTETINEKEKVLTKSVRKESIYRPRGRKIVEDEISIDSKTKIEILETIEKHSDQAPTGMMFVPINLMKNRRISEIKRLKL